MTPNDFGLLCPFLDQSAAYSAGVEFGMLWRRLRKHRRIKGYFTVANQDQILLAASRLGWKVVEMRPWQDFPDQWFWLKMER